MKKTIQDVLSSVKTALTSDTGKAIGAGLAGVTAGALLGGEGGVQAVGGIGSAIQGIRERRKKEAIEAENRDLRNLQRTKAELELASAKETQKLQPMREREAQLRLDEIQERINTSKEKREATYGMINRDDVAIEPKPVKSSGKSTTEKTPKFKPTPIARTGPASAMVNDEKQLIKNVEKIQSSAAADAAGLAQKLGVVGLGREYLLKNRRDLAEQVKAYNFEPEYEKAFWRELQEQIAPGSIARAKEMLAAEPEYTTKEAFAENWPAAVGSVAGSFIGAMPGIASLNIPLAIAGGSAGFTAGNYAGRSYDEWSSSQKDVTPTPAVAGADKTAADMASYSMSLEATKLLNNLNTTQPQDIPAIIQQLPQLANFKALPVGDQERILADLRGRVRGIGMNYGIPKEVESFRNTINDMGSWATRKLGIGG